MIRDSRCVNNGIEENPSTKHLVAISSLYVIVSRVFVPLGLVGGTVLLIATLLYGLGVLVLDGMKLEVPRFLAVEFLFIIITAITSFIVCRNQTSVVTSVQSLLYGLIFGYGMITTSLRNNSVEWFIKVFVLTGYILTGYLLITGGVSSGRLARISVSENMNPNTLGVYMVFCIWGLLYLLSNKIQSAKNNNIKVRLYDIILFIGSVALFLYVILGTGSRKALLACVFMLAIWIAFALSPLLKSIQGMRRYALVFLGAALILLIILKFGYLFETISGTTITRLQVLNDEGVSSTGRLALIKDSLSVFKQYPFVGVGWNNYKFYSIYSLYSHCTYTEVLACTGIIGGIIALILWLMLFVLWIRKMKEDEWIVYKVLISVLFASLLFIDAVQIMYYNITLLMIFHLLFMLNYQSTVDCIERSV